MIADRIEAWKDRVRDTEARRLEIEESKKQQELLVDITSHEIRNPTSAIIGPFSPLSFYSVLLFHTLTSLSPSPAASELLRSNINDLLGRVTLNESLIFTSESVATLEDDVSTSSLRRRVRKLDGATDHLPSFFPDSRT